MITSISSISSVNNLGGIFSRAEGFTLVDVTAKGGFLVLTFAGVSTLKEDKLFTSQMHMYLNDQGNEVLRVESLVPLKKVEPKTWRNLWGWFQWQEIE